MALKQWRVHRRLLAGRAAWRQIEERATPIGVWTHLALCLAAVVIACGVLALFSAHLPAQKLLHRWLPGVALIFALLLAGFFSVVLSGWVGRTLLAIPVGALVSYAAGPLAFHFYFAVFETALWRKWLAGTDAWTAAVLTVAVWPSFLLAWLFGALAAGFYLLGATVLEMYGLDAVKAWLARLRPHRE